MTVRTPDYPGAWGYLGKLLRETGRKEEARNAIKRWTEMQPDSAAAWEAYASILLEFQDAAGARQARDKASDIESILFKVRYSAPKRE